MKRLRSRLAREGDERKLKYFACGEYGDKKKRPHYHMILFNYWYPDSKLFTVENGHRYYTSELLEKDWKLGFCMIGSVTFDSAAYVARYTTKKKTGKRASEYEGRKPEFGVMSRGGRTGKGIGRGWYDKYKASLYPHDYVVLNGQKASVPDYYDKQLGEEDPELLERIKTERMENQDLDIQDWRRRRVRHFVQYRRVLDKLPRKLDEEL